MNRLKGMRKIEKLLPHLQKLQEELKQIKTTRLEWNKGTKTHDEVKISPDVLIVDGVIVIGNDSGTEFLDAYGEFRGGYQWIHPDLEAWAKKKGGYWEWRDSGSIVFVEN